VTLIFLGWKISEEAVEAVVVVLGHPVECGLLNVREGRVGAGLEGRSVADRSVFEEPHHGLRGSPVVRIADAADQSGQTFEGHRTPP